MPQLLATWAAEIETVTSLLSAEGPGPRPEYVQS